MNDLASPPPPFSATSTIADWETRGKGARVSSDTSCSIISAGGESGGKKVQEDSGFLRETNMLDVSL